LKIGLKLKESHISMSFVCRQGRRELV